MSRALRCFAQATLPLPAHCIARQPAHLAFLPVSPACRVTRPATDWLDSAHYPPLHASKDTRPLRRACTTHHVRHSAIAAVKRAPPGHRTPKRYDTAHQRHRFLAAGRSMSHALQLCRPASSHRAPFNPRIAASTGRSCCLPASLVARNCSGVSSLGSTISYTPLHALTIFCPRTHSAPRTSGHAYRDRPPNHVRIFHILLLHDSPRHFSSCLPVSVFFACSAPWPRPLLPGLSEPAGSPSSPVPF